ncbi:hypothetical protein [Roseburia sp. 831b]|uniref:hypothetical protein n=1 Tax=Roseburia sp. 831b TaxID=1261635 RepID=UPI000951E2DB|nr:IS66 family insertion sequence element accessory protein TnpB [Roseburia sp. 831b]WVK71982.1 IS66 family insertion sequence element accessory protein TnpB [Roseburia sp. 831b]WVK72628.1 IS66 family insertion sequence element accessory protein TnpB [Roseburia sp. 831b]WVK72883.1 IS66 family insertion sequence element accessory protein TnpB [Roseburia sp. 831b]WVK73158.1 IS66 family insertion sequence element accessory protein TnpB [Roseburia sp. 831b]
MKSQTSIASRNCRIQEWAQMIQDCNNRPVGMSVSEWCQEHSITTANYYYRMTQVRKACLDSLPSEVVEQAIVPVPTNLMTNGNYSFAETNQECDESFIELSAHGVTLRVTENTSSSLLSKVLGVLAHVE